MGKLKDTRNINGKTFRYAEGVNSKKYAEELAKKYRKGGYCARVISIHHGYTRVFVRRKKQ